jgi:hypothetical protein
LAYQAESIGRSGYLRLENQAYMNNFGWYWIFQTDIEVSIHSRERCITRQTEVNISEMKPGKNDIKAEIIFETDEMKLLQENTWQMDESFGLDKRINNLTGKRKVGFYSWDLDCLECVVSDLQKSPKDKEVADRIARKIEESYLFIKEKQNDL